MEPQLPQPGAPVETRPQHTPAEQDTVAPPAPTIPWSRPMITRHGIQQTLSSGSPTGTGTTP
jgi:hypothetical protein